MAPKIDLNQALNNQVFAVQASKESSKKSKDLLQLATILQGLEEEIASTKGAISSSSQVTPAANNAQGSSTSPFGQAMAQMAFAMQMLEVAISKADHSKANNDYSIAQSQMKLAQSQFNDVQSKILEIEKEKEKESTINFWTKFAEIAAAVIITGIALAFGQVEIAAMTIAMTALSVSGAFEKAADGVSSLLQDCGVPKLTADIIAKVFVLVVVIALTFYCAPESAAGEAVDTGTEIGEEASNTAIEMEEMGSSAESTASTASSTASDATSFASKLGKVWKTVNLFNRLSVRSNMIIMNTLQALSQINVNEVIEDIPQGQMSDSKKKELEQILTIVIMIATLLATIGSGSAMSEASSAGKVVSGSSRMSRSLTPIFKTIGRLFSPVVKATATAGGAAVLTGAEITRQALMLAAAGLQIAEGTILINQGNLTKDLAKATANMDLVQVLMEMMNSSAINTIKHDGNVQQQHMSQDKHFQETFAAGEKAFAQLFTTYSPV